MQIVLTSDQVHSLCRQLGERIKAAAGDNRKYPIRIYGIPRGGIPVACLLGYLFPEFTVTFDLSTADYLVDDIIDSGATRTRYLTKTGKMTLAMIDKTESGNEFKDAWIVFPWEANEKEGTGVEDNIVRLLQFIGEDPTRGGLLDTPKRVAKAWQHWCSGYDADIPSLLKTFDDGAEGCDEMVMVRDIPFYTHCEHHMAPFFGTATVAYIPNGKIVGLSKLPRIVDAFARRLQVQERLTNQIADAINDNLFPLGVGVIIKARHLCMESRGIQQQGHCTITSALRGVMRDSAEARAEFLDLAK